MSETERKALVEQLRGILPLLDGLEVGQDCADYSYAKAGGFQAMTYCPDAFEALRCVPEAIARIAALEAENARKDEALRFAHSWLGYWATHIGNCRGGQVCTCGLTRVRYDARAALEARND